MRSIAEHAALTGLTVLAVSGCGENRKMEVYVSAGAPKGYVTDSASSQSTVSDGVAKVYLRVLPANGRATDYRILVLVDDVNLDVTSLDVGLSKEMEMGGHFQYSLSTLSGPQVTNPTWTAEFAVSPDIQIVSGDQLIIRLEFSYTHAGATKEFRVSVPLRRVTITQFESHV